MLGNNTQDGEQGTSLQKNTKNFKKILILTKLVKWLYKAVYVMSEHLRAFYG